MLKGKPAIKPKTTKPTTKTEKAALAVVEKNLERIEAAERGETSPPVATEPTGGPTPAEATPVAPRAKREAAFVPAKGSKKGGKPAAKAPKESKSKKERTRTGGGCLDAAFQVLKANGGDPMTCGDLVTKMLAKGMWSTNGKTPAATLYAAVIREIAAKGKDSRFRKTDRGLFTANAGAK